MELNSHPCLEFALNEWAKDPSLIILYNQDHIVLEKSANYFYSYLGTHSSSEIVNYEDLRITPLTTLLRQFINLTPDYILQLVKYYYKLRNPEYWQQSNTASTVNPFYMNGTTVHPGTGISNLNSPQ